MVPGFAHGSPPYARACAEAIQRRVARDFLSDPAAAQLFSTEDAGFEMLQWAPHTLGRAASRLSNYIKGSFAAFPMVPPIETGEPVPPTCVLRTCTGEEVSLRSLAQNARYTVILAGSVS
jgi:hypothetical protein